MKILIYILQILSFILMQLGSYYWKRLNIYRTFKFTNSLIFVYKSWKNQKMFLSSIFYCLGDILITIQAKSKIFFVLAGASFSIGHILILIKTQKVNIFKVIILSIIFSIIIPGFLYIEQKIELFVAISIASYIAVCASVMVKFVLIRSNLSIAGILFYISDCMLAILIFGQLSVKTAQFTDITLLLAYYLAVEVYYG